MPSTRQLRNIAIIAHVDHGKTTLVDKLLGQAGTFAAHQHIAERVMDSNDLERERGITILAKNTAVDYDGVHINIVDTPGHADFGGEVERSLSMVDGVLLLVDAVEGPMPQTRFVTRKALALGLNPVLVVNKIDRPGARPDWVVNATFDMMDKLGASEHQLDFPVVYASALLGTATLDLSKPGTDMRPLFRTIIDRVPAPKGDPDGPLQLQISNIDYSSYVGRIGIGRIARGRLKPAQEILVLHEGHEPAKAEVGQVMGFRGLERIPMEEASAGDIVLVTGVEETAIGVTFADPLAPEEQHQGPVMEALGGRRADLLDMMPDGRGRVRLDYRIPARGLIGFQSEFLNLTRGNGLMSHVFDEYGPMKAEIPSRRNGVLVSAEQGEAVAYALWKLQERGRMLVSPGERVYEGMVIGVHSRDNDLVGNPIREKPRTNIRAAGKDEAILLTPPIRLTLELAVEFIDDDELIEITPRSIRVRKRYL